MYAYKMAKHSPSENSSDFYAMAYKDWKGIDLVSYNIIKSKLLTIFYKTQTVNVFARFIAAAYVYLQISVVNAPAMAITYGVNKLLEIFPRFAFLQMAVTRLHMAGKGD